MVKCFGPDASAVRNGREIVAEPPVRSSSVAFAAA
jgi:hypothetical protein